MFKLLKINDSPSNTPEIVKLKKASTVAFTVGEALIFEKDNTTRCGPSMRPTHISAAASDVGETTVLAYKVTSDMVFETKLMTDGFVYPGEKLIISGGVGVAQPDEDDIETVASVIVSRDGTAIVFFE